MVFNLSTKNDLNNRLLLFYFLKEKRWPVKQKFDGFCYLSSQIKPSMKRFYCCFFIVFFLLVFMRTPSIAQGDPGGGSGDPTDPGCDPDDPYCPIDSGLAVLLVMGAGYGAIKYIVLNKEKPHLTDK